MAGRVVSVGLPGSPTTIPTGGRFAGRLFGRVGAAPPAGSRRTTQKLVVADPEQPGSSITSRSSKKGDSDGGDAPTLTRGRQTH